MGQGNIQFTFPPLVSIALDNLAIYFSSHATLPTLSHFVRQKMTRALLTCLLSSLVHSWTPSPAPLQSGGTIHFSSGGWNMSGSDVHHPQALPLNVPGLFLFALGCKWGIQWPTPRRPRGWQTEQLIRRSLGFEKLKDHPPDTGWALTRRRNKLLLSEIAEIWAHQMCASS